MLIIVGFTSPLMLVPVLLPVYIAKPSSDGNLLLLVFGPPIVAVVIQAIGFLILMVQRLPPRTAIPLAIFAALGIEGLSFIFLLATASAMFSAAWNSSL